MKRLCKSSDEGVVEVPEDLIIDILRRLPSKSLARFKSVSKCWRNYLPRPYLIGFFYQPRVTRSRPQIRFFFSSTNDSSSRLLLNIVQVWMSYVARTLLKYCLARVRLEDPTSTRRHF